MEKKNNSLIVMAYYKCLHNTHRAPASQKVLLDITVKEGGEVDFSFSLSLTHKYIIGNKVNKCRELKKRQ